MNDYDSVFVNKNNTTAHPSIKIELEKRSRPQRACTKRYSAVYLVMSTKSSHAATFNVAANSASKTLNYTLETKKFFLVNFDHKRTHWVDPKVTRTNKVDEVSIINHGLGQIEVVIYYDRYNAYVYAHKLSKTLKDAIHKKALQLGIRRNREPAKQIRALLCKYTNKATVPKQTPPYNLCDYVRCVLELKDDVEFPKRIVKYLTAANKFFSKTTAMDKEGIARRLAPLFKTSPADIIEAEGIPTFGLYSLHGESLAKKADAMALALKTAAWLHVHRKGKEITKKADIINELHDIAYELRKLKGKKRKKATHACIDKAIVETFHNLIPKAAIPSENDFNRTVNDYQELIPFDKPLRLKTQRQNNRKRVYKKVLDPRTLKPLEIFWQLREEIFCCAVDTWEMFVWHLLQNDKALLWTRMIFAAYSVQKIDAQERVVSIDATISGKNLDMVLDFALELRITMPKHVQAHYWQRLLFPMLSKWFKLRGTTALTLNIISLADFNRRQSIVQDNDWHDINHVLDFIRTGNGPLDYRVRISHAKKRQDSGKDIDCSGKDLGKYKNLLDLIPEIFEAYETLTGHAVTHTNHQPVWKVTSRQRTFGQSCHGCLVVMQNHQFPWASPKLEYGAKHAISPSIPIDGTHVFIDLNVEKLSNGLPSGDWAKRNIHAVKNHLNRDSYNISVDGKECETSLKPMPFANKAMVETGSLFCQNNSSQFTIRDAINDLDRFLKAVIENGSAKMKHFGMDYEFQCSAAPITEHLKLYAKHCKLQYKYFGRTGSAPRTIFAAEWIIEKLNAGCARAEARLNGIVAKVLQEEDHTSKTICKRHYVPYKSDALKPFAEIHNETHRYIEVCEGFDSMTAKRLASGTYRPSLQNIKVNGFVEPRVPFGSLKERCDNVHHLTITEQDAQASFLAMVERRNQLILQLAADDAIASNSAFQQVKSEVEEEMKEAQHLWDAKNSTGICTRVTNAGKRAWESIGLSPSKRHKT